MKDQYSVIIAAAALAFVGVRLYQKYARKGGAQKTDPGKKSSTAIPSSGKDDDYEPYLKK